MAVKKIKYHSLYLIISEEFGKGRSALEIAELAITGGADIIQMREKKKSASELLKSGRDLSRLCAKSSVIFMINDDPSIAKKTGADGVHLGQEDMSTYPIAMARGIMGEDKIIGVSTHSFGQFEKANEEDVDYIAFGPIFPTKTKDYFLGTGNVKKVLGIAKKPVFFIGGIDLLNIDELIGMGAENVALIRGITEAEEIVSKTRQFKNKITGFERG